MEASEKRGLPNGTQEKKKSEMPGMPKDLLYSVDEVPPLGLCILLGFQHYLTAFGGIVSVPLIMNKFFCMGDDYVGLSQLIGTLFFVSGICTLLQTTFGVRLPIIQGGTFTLVGPVIAIMSLPKWKDSCPFLQEEGTYNATDLPPTGGAEHKELWQQRLREVQGDIMLASIFQVVIGFTGLMGFITRFIGPLAVVPTISLIGLALFNEAAALASKQWYIAIMTIFLILLFSQYLRNFSIPICKCSRKGCGVMKLPIFKLFPVLMGMIASWVICSILTVAGVLTDDVDSWGYAARTDTKISVLNEAAWFRFPYPGQWGTPTASVAGVFGVLAGIIGSMIESVGDYYACARLSGAPPPPVHAMNRGIGMEGLGCVIAGAFGTGNATTSYSENVGAIGITKVGSRRVVQVGGIIMLILGCLNKFGALFVTIPDPVIGGMFLVTFGMVVAVGISNLQYVDLSSPRNICILGLSIFFGLSFPLWVRANPSSINTGSATLDQILVVLLETNMFIGGFVGFVLDLTVPGTEEERGIKKWRAVSSIRGDVERSPVYDFPLVQKFFNRIKCFRLLPFCPSFINCCERHTNYDVDSHGNENEAYDDATESRNRTPMNDTQF